MPILGLRWLLKVRALVKDVYLTFSNKNYRFHAG